MLRLCRIELGSPIIIDCEDPEEVPNLPGSHSHRTLMSYNLDKDKRSAIPLFQPRFALYLLSWRPERHTATLLPVLTVAEAGLLPTTNIDRTGEPRYRCHHMRGTVMRKPRLLIEVGVTDGLNVYFSPILVLPCFTAPLGCLRPSSPTESSHERLSNSSNADRGLSRRASTSRGGHYCPSSPAAPIVGQRSL